MKNQQVFFILRRKTSELQKEMDRMKKNKKKIEDKLLRQKDVKNI